MTDTRRLFFALWPSAGLQRQMQQLARKVAPSGAGRLVAAENLHITLAFLGSIDTDTQSCIENAVTSEQIGPFTLLLDQAGYWARPRVVWLGCRDTPSPLLALARRLAAIMAGCGLQPESRPFAAHLTVMRKASRGPTSTDIPPLEWNVADFALVESLTLPAGAQYRVLRRWPLAGTAPVQD